MKITPNPAYQDLRAEITPEPAFLNRRRFVAASGALGAGLALASCGPKPAPGAAGGDLPIRKTNWTVSDPPADEKTAFGYNNYYEFGTSKTDPAKYAGRMTTSPWAVAVEGETEAAGTFGLKDLIDYDALEERVYRHRCVEAWSMVIPWVGVPLASVIGKLKPKASARFVQFETYLNADEMPGVKAFPPPLDWPYVEGLRLDEAMNELAFVAVGAYGKMLPPQNGAPVRTVLPWKYGFKGTKSIVKIRFTAEQPATAWNKAAANEYGFYSNVNPNVSHPRWSQAQERVLGQGGFGKTRATEMFNGYGAQVAKLYEGMDLTANY